MSENQELENGQKVIPACLFCGAKFVESQALDEKHNLSKRKWGLRTHIQVIANQFSNQTPEKR